MKVKEFIKKVEELGFGVFNEDDYYVIKDEYGCVVATVSKITLAQMTTDYIGWDDLYDEDKIKLFNLLIELAATPIEDREEEKKFYLKHKFLYNNASAFSSDKYLNHKFANDSYFIDDLYQNEDVKTQFTLNEIEEIEDKFDTNLDDFELIEVK